MENDYKPKEKGAFIGDIFLKKKDLLRALSWFDLVNDPLITEEDRRARENLIRIITFLTRNG